MKCPGKDKFGKECTVYLRPNETFCWKHMENENNNNNNNNDNHNKNNKKQKLNLKIDNKRLETLANDDENVHTPEIQIPLIRKLKELQSYAKGMKINAELYLPDMIASMIEPEEINVTTELALEHLRHCFQQIDSTKIFDLTYQEVCTYVWFRINYMFQENEEKLKLLRERFFQEVSESIGQCLNGNIARLMNVFSGVDDEMSIQFATITKDQFVNLLLENIDLLTPEMAMQRCYQLLQKAQIPEDEWGYWIDAVRERKGIEMGTWYVTMRNDEEVFED